ncbi:hypothetical protein OG21DRAFT_1503796 [Imleria badia]|nr:hypothetical protein OG21DRAFT_1503796 [Imleria badia]
MPSSGPSSATTSSTSLTHSSSSPTGSTTAPASSTHTTTSTSSTTSTSTSTTPTTPTPTPTSTPSVSNVVHTSSDGTSVVYLTSTLPAASATAASHTSFLQNPSLEGGVFAAVAIAVLIIGFVVVTWTLRTRRRNRLERDLATAITFDPGAAEHYEHQEDTIEKPRLSGSSSSHGHGYGFGYGVQLAYAPQQEYHGPIGYGQYPVPAYYTASPNPAPYQVPSPTVPQPAEQGGANLTRKFSDRKPVPPLLPNPTYDPSNSHVSIPPQFYQQ